MGVRLDKWLHVARMFKTRSQATEACTSGAIRVNGSQAKAHRNVLVGDRIEFRRGDWERILIVRKLAERSLARAEAGLLYEDLSPPPPARDPLQSFLRRSAGWREKGQGRPTKRERRALKRLKGFDAE